MIPNDSERQTTILLAEDEQAVGAFIAAALSSCGFHVLNAIDGSQALEMAREHKGEIDLLLSDIRMPEMTGAELAKEIRKVRPETKILLMSGYSPEDSLEPDWNFLPKPFTVELLLNMVKRSLEQIRQAREYAEAIVETIREPLLVLDANLKVLTANNRFYEKFQISAEQTIGSHIFELGRGQWNIPRLREFLEDRLPVDQWIEDFEVEFDLPTIGRRYMLLDARQIRQAGLGTGMILLAARDITDRKKAEESLRKSESAIRSLLESAPRAIVASDATGCIRVANRMAETIFGCAREELLGKPVAALLPEETETTEALSRDGARETVGLRNGNTLFPAEVTVSSIETEDGTLVVRFIADITKRKESEAALLGYQEALQGLTAKLISVQESESKHLARELHDVFSQRLAVLCMEITELQQWPAEKAGELNRRLRLLVDKVGALATDIHQISRRLHPAILDDLGLTAALKNECLAFAQQNGISVPFTSERVPRALPEDVALCLYRVAQESLRNTSKHAHAHEVRVSIAGEPDHIELWISDDGGGFDFASAKGKGGLGLVSMEERVRLVKGSFVIQSQPGKGTEIRVRIPLQKDQA
jgi:PAS domain S-box-containing protein